MEALKWLQEHDIPKHVDFQRIDLCGHASLHDNLPALKWARNKGCPWSEQTFQNAAKNGNIEMLQYCLDNGCPKNENVYFWKMEIDTLKWLQRHSFPWNKEIYRAAKGAEAMDWAQDNSCPYDEDTIYRYIKFGSISSIEKCLQSHDYLIVVEKAYNEALWGFPRNNNSLIIEKLQLLRKYGYEWTANLCAQAARRGNLRILQWLRHNGCSWNAKTCAGAVLSCNIEMLKYAHENGCEWDKETYANCFAVYDGSYYPEPTEKIVLRECRDILEYLKKNNCPKPEDSDWNEKPDDVEFGIEIEDEDMPEDSDWNVVPDDVEFGT